VETIVPFAAILLLVVALVMWGRWVHRKHESESIYEPAKGSDAHKRDPFFQENFGDRLH